MELINLERTMNVNPPTRAEIYRIPSRAALPAVSIVVHAIDMNKWINGLDRMGTLAPGWNGYSAAAPSRAAILTAEFFICSG